MDGKSVLLKGNYQRRAFAIRKCALVCAARGYKMFAIQHGGWCATGPWAHRTFAKYGRSNRCRNGKGGPWANDVYRVSGEAELCVIQSDSQSVLARNISKRLCLATFLIADVFINVLNRKLKRKKRNKIVKIHGN